jgi:hypothetical protein
LEALLRLADVKGVDRKTSLLHFVVAQVCEAGCVDGVGRTLWV